MFMGRCKGAWAGVTVVRKCDSHKGGVKGKSVDGEVRWSCGRCKRIWRGVTPVSMLRVYLTVIGEVFISASFYQKIQQTMKIQEIPRNSKVLGAPWISLKILESARFVGFSGKSLAALHA